MVYTTSTQRQVPRPRAQEWKGSQMDGWMDGLLAILLFFHNNMQLKLANWAYDRICWTGKLTRD